MNPPPDRPGADDSEPTPDPAAPAPPHVATPAADPVVHGGPDADVDAQADGDDADGDDADADDAHADDTDGYDADGDDADGHADTDADVDGGADHEPGVEPGTEPGGVDADLVGAPAEEAPGAGAEDDPLAALVELAEALGVATEFWDWQGERVEVPAQTIVEVLAAMDIEIRTADDVLSALQDVRLRPWRLLLPDVVVTRAGERVLVPVHVDEDAAGGVEVWFQPEDGEPQPVRRTDQEPVSATIDGRPVVQLVFELPADLPLGWHTLHARHPDPAGGDVRASRPYVVTPDRLRLPDDVTRERAWGFMTQLYSVRSARSWGVGDLADLAEIAGWSARTHGADFVLVNPLHAAQPIPPMEPSPYLPSSRRFVNPLYLRVEDVPEIAYLPATERAIVEWQAQAQQARNADAAQLDRDDAWAAKSAALRSVFAVPRSRERQAQFDDYRRREGQGLADFAMWCALAEQYGLPTSTWPAHALDPHGDAVAHMHTEFADSVEFHMWLQWCLDEQLARTAAVARQAGMSIGVVHDLAVGVHPDGADAWALGDVLARGVSAGAPPDAFNQQGQDWSQPPWRPDRLVRSGYLPYRDMLRTVLRHAGALRVDHVIGLFRLWWVPRGASPDQGTYVRYDHEALVGILALEAWRAGAFVIGEDLGTVEPWARYYLLERGVLGTSILWFEKDGDGAPLPPQSWRELCLATVTTHDLPPTAGYLAGEHVELRQRLGLLTRPFEQELRLDQADQAAVMRQLQDLGLLGRDPSERDRIEALHAFLTLTPARLVGVALADAVGDRRTMNQPGTSDEYPNWRLPLSDGVGRAVLLDEVMTSIRVDSLAATVEDRLHPGDAGPGSPDATVEDSAEAHPAAVSAAARRHSGAADPAAETGPIPLA